MVKIQAETAERTSPSSALRLVLSIVLSAALALAVIGVPGAKALAAASGKYVYQSVYVCGYDMGSKTNGSGTLAFMTNAKAASQDTMRLKGNVVSATKGVLSKYKGITAAEFYGKVGSGQFNVSSTENSVQKAADSAFAMQSSTYKFKVSSDASKISILNAKNATVKTFNAPAGTKRIDVDNASYSIPNTYLQARAYSSKEWSSDEKVLGTWILNKKTGANTYTACNTGSAYLSELTSLDPKTGWQTSKLKYFYVYTGTKLVILNKDLSTKCTKSMKTGSVWLSSAPFGYIMNSYSYNPTTGKSTSKTEGLNASFKSCNYTDYRFVSPNVFYVKSSKGWSLVNDKMKTIKVLGKYTLGMQNDTNLYGGVNKVKRPGMGLTYVRNSKGKIGAVDKNGKIAIPFNYDGYFDFGGNSAKYILLMKKNAKGKSTWQFFALSNVKTMSSAKVSGVKASYKYTGKAVKPSVTVKMSTKTLKKGIDYTVKYTSNVKKGTAKITITGKGKYTGTLAKTFKIK